MTSRSCRPSALRQIGYTANRRLLGVQRLSHDPITGAEALHAACDPVIHSDGARTAGLRFTDMRVQALLHILLIFRLQPSGFRNKDLRELLAEHLGRPPGTITPGQATYDLRRLREHGLIERIPAGKDALAPKFLLIHGVRHRVRRR
jgi:DNA-binding transcriptional ArsR family regulator